MKKINFSRILLSLALTGAFGVTPLLTPTAQADPPRQAPAYGRRAKDKKDKKTKKDKKYDKRDDRRDRDDRDRYDRDRYDRDRDYRDRYDRDNRRNNATYTGVVTAVRSNGFDLRSNGRTYNVYISSVPRDLSRGDQVRVYGRPYGSNDIRNATVRVISNRDGDRPDNNSNGYQTLRGRVVKIENSRQFDIIIGTKIYNVYASSSTRDLDLGDEVRIYGQRVGSNDIRNANVSITRNR